MTLRSIKITDYQQLILFWEENYFVSEMDNKKRFIAFLKKNPDLSVLLENDDEIIATVLGSYDGRRGYIQKVVTAKNYRGKGYGTQVVKEVIKRLKKTGAVYIPISAEKENISFYEKCGFKKKTSISMSMDLEG